MWHQVYAEGLVPDSRQGDALDDLCDTIQRTFETLFDTPSVHVASIDGVDRIEVLFQVNDDARKLRAQVEEMSVRGTDEFGDWEFEVNSAEVD